MIDAHFVALTDLTPPPYDVQKLRQMYDTMENHLQSLHAIGENIEQRQLVLLIKSKLPFEIMHRLNMQQDDNTVWTVENL